MAHNGQRSGEPSTVSWSPTTRPAGLLLKKRDSPMSSWN